MARRGKQAVERAGADRALSELQAKLSRTATAGVPLPETEE